MDDRVRGRVKFFKEDKGYGFAKCDGDRREVFIHRSQLPDGVDQLNKDQQVSFMLRESRKGLQAVDVRVE